MFKYIIKRLLLSILILFGVSVILYVLIRVMPADYILQLATQKAGNSGNVMEEYKNIQAQYGLDVGIVRGYIDWLTKFVQGDMGVSFKYKQPVEDVIFENMGVSFAISFIALVLQLVIAIPLGIKCACNQYGKLDYIVTVITIRETVITTQRMN